METNAAQGALSNYAAALKTMDATFTFISVTAFSSTAEKSRAGHKAAAQPDRLWLLPESAVCLPHLGRRCATSFSAVG